MIHRRGPDIAVPARGLAAPLLRGGLDPRVRELLAPLAGKISDDEMQALNEKASATSGAFDAIAADFLRSRGLRSGAAVAQPSTVWTRLWPRLRQHVFLTAVSLLAGMAVVADEDAASAHAVREYRNSLIHDRQQPVELFSVRDTTRHLGTFLGWLQKYW